MQFAASADPDDPAVIVLSGELDVVSAPLLEDAYLAVAEQHGRLVLDIARVTFLDSSGIAAMVRIHHVLTGRGGGLVLRHPSARVADLLRITDLDRVFSVEP